MPRLRRYREIHPSERLGGKKKKRSLSGELGLSGGKSSTLAKRECKSFGSSTGFRPLEATIFFDPGLSSWSTPVPGELVSEYYGSLRAVAFWGLPAKFFGNFAFDLHLPGVLVRMSCKNGPSSTTRWFSFIISPGGLPNDRHVRPPHLCLVRPKFAAALGRSRYDPT